MSAHLNEVRGNQNFELLRPLVAELDADAIAEQQVHPER